METLYIFTRRKGSLHLWDGEGIQGQKYGRSWGDVGRSQILL